MHMNHSESSAVMQRIRAVLDRESFVERGAGIRPALRFTDGIPGDGAVTGSGLVNGDLVFLGAQDSSVYGGSVGLSHAAKFRRIYEEAAKVKAPVIEILDSTGIRLEEAGEVMREMGELIRVKAELRHVVPMVTLIAGNCAGVLAILASMSDYVVMLEDASCFVTAPDAVIGQKDAGSSSARHQAAEGNVDFVGNLTDAAAYIRSVLTYLPVDNRGLPEFEPAEDPLNRKTEDFFRADARTSLRMIADDGVFLERRIGSERGMVTGLIRINGQTVGAVVTEEEKLKPEGMQEAASWIRFCNDFRIPVLTIADTTGFSRTQQEEPLVGRSAADLAAAYGEADIPKITVVKRACGTAGIIMGSVMLGADLVIGYSESKTELLPDDIAGMIMAEKNTKEAQKQAAAMFREKQNSLEAAVGRGRIDTIILPEETRQQLAAAFEIYFPKTERK
ncbi:MAG TPA: carboxyl transferase [Eubacterium sp.]|nr:carboxyl transferase [Eubacterium sp.]